MIEIIVLGLLGLLAVAGYVQSGKTQTCVSSLVKTKIARQIADDAQRTKTRLAGTTFVRSTYA